MRGSKFWLLSTVGARATVMLPAAAQAQEAASNDSGLEDIVVTARKKAQAELVQDVPIAISAISGDQLERSRAKTLTALASAIPNVSLDDVGTVKGTAIFSVRGLGLNSSIPTLEPTTGVFVDGVYMGISQGILVDLFDLDGVEILRGPQGTLFGKNVTGGAVLLRSRAPSDTFEARARVSVETGSEYKGAVSLSGPLAPGLSARLSVLYDKDEGWFRNDFDNSEYGETETVIIRPSIRWASPAGLETTLRYEHGEITGDPVPNQNFAFDDRTGFHFSNNIGRGGVKTRWDQVTSETVIDTAFGDGNITNIAGYKKLNNSSVTDADGTSINGFHIRFRTDYSQFSNELRYAGSFWDTLDLTFGVYYFHSNLDYLEQRFVKPLAFAPRAFGGRQKQDTYAVFGQGDVSLTDNLTLTLGARYSIDKKHADVASFSGAGNTCSFDTGVCAYTDPDLRRTWKSFTPKIGLQYEVSSDAQVYASATRAYRAGGFNVRITSPAQSRVFNQEETTAFEIGGKADFFDGRLRTNFAAYYNLVDDMIRDVTLPTGAGAVVQDSRNTADVKLWGIEFETKVRLADGLMLSGFLGYQNDKYRKIRFNLVDLPGEVSGTINANDYALHVPRLVPWSFGFGAEYSRELDGGSVVSARANYSRKTAAFGTDDNRAKLSPLDTLDASLSVEIKQLTLSVFGKNLLNSAYQGFVVVLPGSVQPPLPAGVPFGTLGSMSEGRSVGVEASFKF